MANPERPAPLQGNEHGRQEDEPIFTLTLGDVQLIAQKTLTRNLTDDELNAVMKTFHNAFNWPFYLEQSIRAGQEWGRVGPSTLGRPPDDENFQAIEAPSREEGVKKDFLVYYSLSGAMRVNSTGEEEASEDVFADLHTLVGKSRREGMTAEEAGRIQFYEAEVEIDSVETVPSGQENLNIEPPAQQYFEITSLSREDLEDRGFDTSEVTDEMMKRLANKMADDYLDQLYWSSLDLIAEELGIPKRPR